MSIILFSSLGIIGKHSETSLPIENQAGMQIVNLGTGLPDRALKMNSYFESSRGQRILVQIGKRRDGAVAIYYTRADRAKSILGSQVKHGLEEMCKLSWYCQEQQQESKSLGH